MLRILTEKTWILRDFAWICEDPAKIICEEFIEKEDGSNYPELRLFCCNGETLDMLHELNSGIIKNDNGIVVGEAKNVFELKKA